MSNADLRGRFVWHELMTTDTASAIAFYSRVLPWTTQQWDQDSSYTMWVTASGPVGGVMALPAGTSDQPSWLPYIATPDIEATVESAKNLGGTVVKEPTEIANVGKYAVLKDPQGATFGLYQPPPGQPAGNETAEVGDFSWHELYTTDYEAALRFYTELVGWEKGRAHDMGPEGVYQIFLHGGKEIGGMFNSDALGTGPQWLCYARVDDAGRAATRAKSAGGRVINGPMEVPNGDWIAQVIDPQGAAFAVHELRAAGAAAESGTTAEPAAAEAPPAKQKKPAPAKKKPAASAAKKAPPKAAKKAGKKAAKKAGKKAAKKAPARAARKSAKKAPRKAARKARGKAARRSARKAAPRRKASRKAGRKRARGRR